VTAFKTFTFRGARHTAYIYKKKMQEVDAYTWLCCKYLQRDYFNLNFLNQPTYHPSAYHSFLSASPPFETAGIQVWPATKFCSAILSSCVFFSLVLSQFSRKYNRQWQMLNPHFTPYPCLPVWLCPFPCSLFYWQKFVQQPLTQMFSVVCRIQFSLLLSFTLSLPQSAPVQILCQAPVES